MLTGACTAHFGSTSCGNCSCGTKSSGCCVWHASDLRLPRGCGSGGWGSPLCRQRTQLLQQSPACKGAGPHRNLRQGCDGQSLQRRTAHAARLHSAETSWSTQQAQPSQPCPHKPCKQSPAGIAGAPSHVAALA